MMNSLFDPENSFWSFMTKVTNVFYISILWFICCLPIITIGASTTALLQYTLKLTTDTEGYATKSFFKAFKNNFIQATIVWIIVLLVGGFLTVDAYICLKMGNVLGNILFFLITSLGIIFIFICIYIFPIISLYKVNIRRAFSNSFIMSLGNLYITITIVLIIAMVAVLVYFKPIFIVISGGLIAFLSSYLFQTVFNKYMSDKENMPEED